MTQNTPWDVQPPSTTRRKGESNEVGQADTAGHHSLAAASAFIGASSASLWERTGAATERSQIAAGTRTGNDGKVLKALITQLTFPAARSVPTCVYEGNLEFNVRMDGEGVFYDPEGKEFTRGPGSSGLCAAQENGQADDQQRGRELARPLCFPAPVTRFSGSGLLRSPSRELPLPCRQACLHTRGSVRCTDPRV